LILGNTLFLFGGGSRLFDKAGFDDIHVWGYRGCRRCSTSSQGEHHNENKQHKETGPGFHFILREKRFVFGVNRMTMEERKSSAEL
jgi:hypothetical protein